MENDLRESSVSTEWPIAHLAQLGDLRKVQAAILGLYGFEPTLDYCRDLIKFVLTLTGSRNEPRN